MHCSSVTAMCQIIMHVHVCAQEACMLPGYFPMHCTLVTTHPPHHCACARVYAGSACAPWLLQPICCTSVTTRLPLKSMVGGKEMQGTLCCKLQGSKTCL
eukprot:1144295-Pelagomonas_calceolata.AAC.4